VSAAQRKRITIGIISFVEGSLCDVNDGGRLGIERYEGYVCEIEKWRVKLETLVFCRTGGGANGSLIKSLAN
jgi:hypothetical protein